MPGNTPSGLDAHHDAPLSNVAVKAFDGSDGFIAQAVFPVVQVAKESDRYYIIDPDSWLRDNISYRARKGSPNEVEFQVSSDGYHADNYALKTAIANEDLANQDNALRLRENATNFVTEMILRGNEIRVANTVTSGTNLGSYVSLSGTAKWSDYANSDPISDVTTARSFIRNKTGIPANTMIIDHDTKEIVRRHPLLLDYYKYTAGGLLSDEQLSAAFSVQNILTAGGIKNNALAGATSSITNIWGNNVILANIQPGMTMQTRTFGLTFRWSPAGLPGQAQAFRYPDPDPGKKVEIVEVGVYQAEKIVAKDLSYGILAPI